MNIICLKIVHNNCKIFQMKYYKSRNSILNDLFIKYKILFNLLICCNIYKQNISNVEIKVV